MNAADWAIVIVVLVSTVTAAFRGFLHQAFGMAGLIAGYMLAAWQYPRVAALHDAVLERPNIAVYVDSERRIPFNESGIFRHYPELDQDA